MAGRARFPHVFKPLDLNHGRVTLKNRVLMGSMHTGLEDVETGGRLEDMAEYFAARARGGVGLSVTGGIAPNNAGRVTYMAAKLSTAREMRKHQCVAEAVHSEGGKIAMQILHSGRYGYHHWAVAPSAVKSPISMFKPKALSGGDVERTIDDFVTCAQLASEAGYDGVEIMGSEGYLINQFIAAEANKRTDDWGGAYEKRIRFPIEIVRRTREALGPDPIIIYRLSLLDLVQGGSTWAEIELLAQEVERAGASILNSGIGWHQARVPTIATSVPRGGFAWVTKKLMGKVDIPLIATNRINTPATAEQVLADGYSDMVSMARPFLADPAFVHKAAEGREDEINSTCFPLVVFFLRSTHPPTHPPTSSLSSPSLWPVACISCNQSCLDHVFQSKRASCLVNPSAGYEKDLVLRPVAEQTKAKLKVAVVGAGPAGLACAVSCAERGIDTHLFDKDSAIGGQFNLAKRIPGKEEFFETLRYFGKQIELQGVTLKLDHEVDRAQLHAAGFTHVVLATGVTPRAVTFPGADHPAVVSYLDVLTGKATLAPDAKVAVIGAGGIGFDVSEFLSHPGGKLTEHGPKPGIADDAQIKSFANEWNIDLDNEQRGGMTKNEDKSDGVAREIWLLQRGKGKVGANLGKTTGWIHRTSLKQRGVHMMRGVKYVKFDDQGMHIERNGKPEVLPVDNVVVCAGQLPNRQLWDEAQADSESDAKFFLIGGSQEASELDAARAIDQGTRLAAVIDTASTGDVFSRPVTLSSVVFQKVQSFMK